MSVNKEDAHDKIANNKTLNRNIIYNYFFVVLNVIIRQDPVVTSNILLIHA